MSRLILMLLALSCAFTVSASPFLTQYASPRTVRGMLVDGTTLWMATSGGLLKATSTSKEPTVHAQAADMRDINLVAVVKQSPDLFWLASVGGYVIAFDPRAERATAYNSLAYAGWDVTCMESFGQHLLVGSTRGLSFFSTASRAVAFNAKRFGSFDQTAVSDVAVRGDTIAVALPQGIAWISAPDLRAVNFNDPAVWNTISAVGVVSVTFGPDGQILPSKRRFHTQSATRFEVLDTAEYINDTTSVPYTVVVRDGAQVGPRITRPVDILSVAQWGGTVWLGTYDQTLMRLSGDSLWEPVALNGPVSSDIRQAVVDRDGTLWYVMSNSGRGIGKMRNGVWGVITGESDSTRGVGLLDGGMNAAMNRVFQTSGGDLWFGFHAMGAKWYQRQTGQWRNFMDVAFPFSSSLQTTPSPLARFQSDLGAWWTFVGAFCEDSSGFIWMANERAWNDSAIHCFDPATSRWASINRTSSGLPGKFVRSLEAGPSRTPGENLLYIGVGEDETFANFGCAVARYTDPFNAPITVTQGPYSYPFYDIAVSGDSLAWYASSVGLHRVRNGDIRNIRQMESVRPTRPINSVVMSPRGNPVFAMNGDLFEYYDSTDARYDDSLVNLTSSGVLGDDVWDVMYEAAQARYWISTAKGLYAFKSGDYYEPAQAGIRQMIIYPNPLSRSKRDAFVTFDRLPLNSTVVIHDISGALIWRAASSDMHGTRGQMCRWDGRNTAGKPVLPGTYYYKVYSGDTKKAGKVLVIP